MSYLLQADFSHLKLLSEKLVQAKASAVSPPAPRSRWPCCHLLRAGCLSALPWPSRGEVVWHALEGCSWAKKNLWKGRGTLVRCHPSFSLVPSHCCLMNIPNTAALCRGKRQKLLTLVKLENQ